MQMVRIESTEYDCSAFTFLFPFFSYISLATHYYSFVLFDYDTAWILPDIFAL